MKRLPDLYGWTLYLRGYKASPGIRAAIRRDGGAATARYLHEMLQRAIRDVPHYASLPRGVGDPFEQLSRMPILTKDDIRAHFEQLTSCDLHRRRWFRNSSGGSTGQPVTLLQDREYTQWSEGTLAYYFETFLGLRSTNVPKVVLWGAERDILARQRSRKSRLADAMSRTVFFNSFRMTPADLRACVETINHVRPVFIRGYAGSLYEVAQFIEREGLTVHRPRFIYSAAETLRPFMREVIEHAFECNVYDFYGSREVGPIAGECREGQKHLFTFHNVVEVVDAEGRPVGRARRAASS